MPPLQDGASPGQQLARLDEIRTLYSRLVTLCAARDEALKAEAGDLVHAARPDAGSTAAQGAGASLPLHEALKQFPSFLGTASLLLAPPGETGDALAPEREDVISRISQLDEALAMLEAIAAAPASGAAALPAASASSERNSHGATTRSSCDMATLMAGDAELRHHLSVAAKPMRAELAASSEAETPADEASASRLLLPLGSSLCRPYLSASARARMHAQNEMHAKHAAVAAEIEAAADGRPFRPTVPSTGGGEALMVRLPSGAKGSAPALKMRRGDALHVPFSTSEAALLSSVLGGHGYVAVEARMATKAARASKPAQEGAADADAADASERMLHMWARGEAREEPQPAARNAADERADDDTVDEANAMGDPKLLSAMHEASALLPGRSVVDCVRFWLSGECPRVAPSAAAPVAASEPGPRPPAPSAASEKFMWRLDSTHASAMHASHAAVPAGRKRAMPSADDGVDSSVVGVAARADTARRLASRALKPSQLLSSVTMRGVSGVGRLPGFGSLDFRTSMLRALHCGYRASSVSTKPTGHVADLAFGPSMQHARLAVGSTTAPHEALLFDLKTGKCIVLGGNEPLRSPPAAHGATVPCVRFTCDGARVLTASYDQTVRVWSASDGALQHVLGVPVAPPPPVPDDVPNNENAEGGGEAGGEGGEGGGGEGGEGGGGGAEGGGEAVMGEMDIEPMPAVEIEVDPEEAAAAAEIAAGVAAAAAAAAEPAPPGPWAYVGTLAGHKKDVTSVAAHPTLPELAASGGKDGYTILWDVSRGEARRRIKARADPLDLCFGHEESDGLLFGAIDEQQTATSTTGGMLAMWDVESGTLVNYVPQAKGHVSCLHVGKGGDTLLMGAKDGTVRQLNALDGREVVSYKTGMSDVNLVSLSCGQTYIQASGDTNETHVFDVRRPASALHVLRHDTVEFVNGVSAAWCHHSNTTLVTGSDDTLVRVWDVSLGRPEVARLHGHTSPVSCVQISPDDALFASGGDEGKAVLYSRRSDAGGVGYLVGKEQDNVLLRQRREDDELARRWAERRE